MTECKFKPGDKIVSKQKGAIVCARVLKVHGNGFMDLDVFKPPHGTWESVPPGGWEHIKSQSRCDKPPQA